MYSTLYWSRNYFTAESMLYLNNSAEPLKINNSADMDEIISKIADVVQSAGVHTIYVNSKDDMALLPFIQKKLSENYNYNHEVKMEVVH